ncbi:GSU2403 family nucleotidyltransferase fold protein [Rugamonas sp.]|uniref:GSU2403 family nucleotidyltransferase fold protein n=1 Tax=Rugamonas sp. TaxID=1926287 RepID=UPI0025F7259E|nr:GSU2403 family nucleotidyltransferase fold protein [Rugamonas sp.]
MRYDDLPDYFVRQMREASTIFTAWRAADAARREHQGSMRWKRVKETDYLIKTSRAGRQRSLGPRSAATAALHARFNAGKAAARERYRALSDAMRHQRHVNKALRIGHVPTLWIQILNAISDGGLTADLTVIGAASTYAYEAAGAIRIRGDGDGAMLAERCGRLQLAAANRDAAIALLALLRKIDDTFSMRDERRDRAAGAIFAVNRRGMEVELVLVHADGSGRGDELRDLLGGPKFHQPVLGLNGDMAAMVTLDPRVFALQKFRIANQLNRTAPERAGAALLARMILAVVRERMPPPPAITADHGDRHAAAPPARIPVVCIGEREQRSRVHRGPAQFNTPCRQRHGGA